MKSLTEDLRSNREQVTKLMKDNNISRICFTDYDGDIDIPNVLLINKNDEPYETSVTDVKLCNDDLYFKVINMKDLRSNSYVDKEGYINYFACAYYTANNVYLAIEDYFVYELDLKDKLNELEKEIKQKFINLLTNEDEKTFTFEDNDMFYVKIGTKAVNFKSIYIKDNRVTLETYAAPNTMPQTFLLNGLCLDDKYYLLKHLKSCLRDKC